MLSTTKTQRYSVSTSGGRSCGRRMGSTISWSQSSPSRLVVFALTRQTNLAIHVGFPLSVQHGPSETSALCVQQARQSPTTFGTLCWRHWCISASGRCCSRCQRRKVGCVALSCHFACDALCAELYDWEAAELG